MTVQASAARRMAERDPERAETAFATVEATGREALTELRRLLGVLRREDEELGARAAAEPRAHRLADRARPRRRPARRAARGRRAGRAPGRRRPDRLPDDPGGAAAGAGVRRRGQRAASASTTARARSGSRSPTTAPPVGRRLLGLRERVAVYGGELRRPRRPAAAGASRPGCRWRRAREAAAADRPAHLRLAARARVRRLGDRQRVHARRPRRPGVADRAGGVELGRRGLHPAHPPARGDRASGRPASWSSAPGGPRRRRSAGCSSACCCSPTRSARGSPGRRSLIAPPAVACAVLAVALTSPGEFVTGDLLFPTFFGVLFWLAGRVVRSRSELTVELHEAALRRARAPRGRGRARGRRGAPADRARDARRRRPQRLDDGHPGRRRAAHPRPRPGARRRGGGADRADRPRGAAGDAPPARRAARRRGPRGARAAADARRPAGARRALGRRGPAGPSCGSRASAASCPPASTSRPTASCRRR